MGSVFGDLFRISTWGESHGKGLGVVIDGCPAGMALCEEDIQKELDRRKPGGSKYATKRKEADAVSIYSGVFEGKTTGTPVSLVIMNEDQKSRDYGDIANTYRPGHADYGFDAKYGIRDYRGGGRSSGRETAARVAAGAVAKKILSELGIRVYAYTKAIGDIEIDRERFDLREAYNNVLVMPDRNAFERASAFLDVCTAQGDSAGGIVECVIAGLKPGIGEPVFDKLDADLAKAVVSIGAVKGIEFGLGFAAAKALGSVNNDCFVAGGSGVAKETNYAGGILGGMSDGTDIIFRAAIKPTPSISQTQKTVNQAHENVEINIKGRHDPIIVPRAVVVVEAMAAVTVVNHIFASLLNRMDTIKKVYLD